MHHAAEALRAGDDDYAAIGRLPESVEKVMITIGAVSSPVGFQHQPFNGGLRMF